MGRAGLDPSDRGRNAEQLDRALGGVDWRTPFRDAEGEAEPTRAAIAVAQGFAEAVARRSKKHFTAIPVRAKPNQLPQYVLILFSSDRRAHSDFADQASKAHEEWLLHCDQENYDAYMRVEEASVSVRLFQDEPPTHEAIAARVASEGEKYLAERITEMLGDRVRSDRSTTSKASTGPGLGGHGRCTFETSSVLSTRPASLMLMRPGRTSWIVRTHRRDDDDNSAHGVS